MTFKLLDRARMSVSGSPGTGNVSLGVATTGYQTFFQAGVVDGDEFPYSIVDGNYWEYGIATYIFSGNQISRAVDKTSAQNNTPLSLSNKAIISACVRAEDVAGNTTLAGLSDVNIVPGSAIDGQVVYWDNTAGRFQTKTVSGGGGGATTLAALTDVNVTEGSPIDGWTLNWNNATSKWVAVAPVTVPAVYVSTITDVTITAPATGDVLTYDNAVGRWKNLPPAGGGGGSALTVSNNGTVVDSAATTLNFVNATSITSASHDVTITLPTGGGGGGGGGSGTPPTLVQSAVVTQSDAPVVLPAAPTPGNLLIAIVSHWSTGATDATWTVLDNFTTGVSNDYLTALYKVATSADTASLSPIYATYQSTSIFEISGASAIGLHTGNHDVTSTTPGFSLLAPTNALVVGQFSTTTGSGAAPTGMTGATQGSTATLGSGSGSPRANTIFTKTTTSVGGVSVVATYASASNTNYYGIVVEGSGGAGVANSSWTPLTFTGTTHSAFGPNGSALTYQQADQTFTVNAGDTIEVDGYIWHTGSNYAEIVASQDGSYGFSLATQPDGNQVLYCYNPSHNAQGAAGNNVIAATGFTQISLRLKVYDTSKTINAWGQVDGWRAIDKNVGGLVDLSGSTLKIYILTDDVTKCVARARVVDPTNVSKLFG